MPACSSQPTHAQRTGSPSCANDHCWRTTPPALTTTRRASQQSSFTRMPSGPEDSYLTVLMPLGSVSVPRRAVRMERRRSDSCFAIAGAGLTSMKRVNGDMSLAGDGREEDGVALIMRFLERGVERYVKET